MFFSIIIMDLGILIQELLGKYISIAKATKPKRC